MTKVPNPFKSSGLNPASRMAFAVAFCALLAAGLGIIVNHWLTGWMAVGGMVGVGLFYLGVGVLNLRSQQPNQDEQSSLNVSQRHASVDNLYAEQIVRPRLNIVPRSNSDQNSSRET